MPRTKQAGHTASKGPTINISDESSDDDIGTEQEEIRPAQVRPKKNPATDTKSTSSKVPIAKETAATLSKAAKGKGKAKIVDEDEMDVDAIDGKPLRRPASAMKISRNQDDLALAEENESLRRQLEAVCGSHSSLPFRSLTLNIASRRKRRIAENGRCNHCTTKPNQERGTATARNCIARSNCGKSVYSRSSSKVPLLIFYMQEEERSSICATRNIQSQNSSISTQIHPLSGSRWSGPKLPGHRRWKNTLLKTRNSEHG